MFNILGLLANAKQCRAHLMHFESVRWKRRPKKPFWLGLAKSKISVIPQKKVYPENEKEEFCKALYVYERKIRSLKMFTDSQSEAKTNPEVLLRLSKEQFKNKMDTTIGINDQWNAECGEARKERIAAEELSREKMIVQKLQEHEEKMKSLKEKAKKIVQEQIELSSTFITEANIDEAIEKSFQNLKDFNYAIDLQGNKCTGDINQTSNSITDSRFKKSISNS